MSSSPTRRRSRGKWLWRAVVIAFVAVAAWTYIDLKELVNSLLRVDPPLVLFILVLITIDRFLMAAKWQHLLRAIDLRIPFVTVLGAYYQAAFIGRIIPSSLSGDILRGYLLTRHAKTWDRVLGSMVVEKAIAVLASVALASVGVLVLSSDLQRVGAAFVILGIPAAAICIGLGFYFSFSERFAAALLGLVNWERVRGPLIKLHNAYCLFSNQRGKLLVNFCLALVEQGLQVAYLWICALAIDVDARPEILLSALALSQFLRKVAIVLEGWALGEFVLVLTCALAGIDQTQVLAFSLLSHAVGVLASSPGAALMIASRRAVVREGGNGGTPSN